MPSSLFHNTALHIRVGLMRVRTLFNVASARWQVITNAAFVWPCICLGYTTILALYGALRTGIFSSAYWFNVRDLRFNGPYRNVKDHNNMRRALFNNPNKKWSIWLGENLHAPSLLWEDLHSQRLFRRGCDLFRAHLHAIPYLF